VFVTVRPFHSSLVFWQGRGMHIEWIFAGCYYRVGS